MRKQGDSERVDHAREAGGDVAVTAVELARMAQVAPADVHYWGRSGYLEKRRNGSSPFPLSQLPKALLMGIFAKQLHMDAENASRLSEKLLPVYAKRPDCVEALRTLASAVESRTETLARFLLDTDFVAKLSDLLKTEEGKRGGP